MSLLDDGNRGSVGGGGVGTAEQADGKGSAVPARDPQQAPRLQLREIYKAFGETTVLHGVDLEVQSGEIHGIVGQNGAGKSTLMNLLGGSYGNYRGAILIDGQHVEPGTPRGALALGVTVVHQEFSLVPTMTVAENIVLGGEANRGFRRKEVIKAARTVIEALGMDQELSLEDRVGSLSASEQQLVEIAKALGRQTKILVLDEPTSRLSLDDRSRLFRLMRNVASTGTSIVFISHFLEEVLGVADRITVLRDGRVVAQGPTATFDVARVSSLMLGGTGTVKAETEQLPTQQSARDGEVLLAVHGVSCGWQVRKVALEVRAGEIVGLAGVVGSGRSSFARGLVGAERIREGTVELCGTPVHFKSPRDAREAGLVLVPEDRAGEGLVAIRSARENVALMALSGSAVRYGFVRHRDVWRKVDQVVRDFEVRPLEMGLTAATFSGGNQQKLLLARAILGKPVVLIVDGPTIGVDVGARVQVQRILRSVAESGSGVLMISNDVEEIAALSDRVLVMRRGAIVAEFEKGEIDKVTLVSVMSASSPLERPILAKSPA